ncbi:hypothetical protein ANCCAN_11887 [Ancylostoma caninum]|uniref:Uncharacterized protein n=1 Tax=Ancylostoma caninum TaxID=29170 RepID=A0A368GGL5_ANCCA|nr:hypothetical protein ANCCAN_11887 [Ancylostoma caninum]
MELTLSMLSIPPVRFLDTTFITDGQSVAVWVSRLPCQDDQVSSSFYNIENVLPLTKTAIRFAVHPLHAVQAIVDQGTSAEIIVNAKEVVDDLRTGISNDVCTINDAQISGCYRYSRGAFAAVKCTSTANSLVAEVECGADNFAIPCFPHGEISKLPFSLSSSQVHMTCHVKCGAYLELFEITRILKYVHNVHEGTELRGSRPLLFANREATLYKCRAEKIQMSANNLKERILGAAQGLKMSYEIYDLLVIAGSASKDSRTGFYRSDLSGVSVDPAFTDEYVRKELDFIDELMQRIANEVREAELQKAVEEKCNTLKKDMERQEQALMDLSKTLETTKMTSSERHDRSSN